MITYYSGIFSIVEASPTMSASTKYRQNVALLADADYVRQVDQLARRTQRTRSDFLAFALNEAAKQLGVQLPPRFSDPANQGGAA